MYSHIVNGHYMFGNTFIQPDMPMYEKIRHHHMTPARRAIPPYPDMIHRPVHCPDGDDAGCCLGYEDCANKIDSPYYNPDDAGEGNGQLNCKDCPFGPNGIIRDPLVNNIVNIETKVVKTIQVTLYGTSKEMDKTVNMKVGGRYLITYITEHGIVASAGLLELISDSVPDACTRYINSNNMAAVSTAYIGMDCSTEGHSDKRKIYIATIRNIEVLEDTDELGTTEVQKMKDQLQYFLDAVEKGELIFCEKSCGSDPDNGIGVKVLEDEDEEGTDDSAEDQDHEGTP